jgi:nucleotide-binding universal stress UspA family protein
MNEKKVLVCVDGSLHSKSACDYGIFIAKQLQLPLTLLNVVEHNHEVKHASLAGNIGLGERDDLLQELTKEEANISKVLITNGKKVLQELSAYAKEQGVEQIHTLQRHGTLDETLQELSSEAKIAIIGLRGADSSGENIAIGKHVEEIIRTLTIPILLVNSAFKPIETILMAYDGSDFANKAIQTATQEPIFPTQKRMVANVNKEKSISQKLLNEAQAIFSKKGIEVQTVSLQGNDTVEALLSYQEEQNLDIIAMGAYSHNRLRSVIFGSFTTKMLQKAKRPLLLFR